MMDGAGEDIASWRRVVLCADDFAQTRGTIEGILSLVDACRITAVSCLVESPLWADAGVRLRSRPSTFDIGLHLNFTHDFAGGGHRATALPLTMLAAYSRAIGRDAVERRLHRQLDLFEEIIGQPPDFVDGHQHVHQLPVVRDALASVLRSRAPSAAVRITVPARYRGPKAGLIAGLGGRALLEIALREKWRHNADFAGVYDFSSPAFADHLSQWLGDLGDGGLIMCHPARGDPVRNDPIARARARELAHLESSAFPAVLQRRRVRLARFRDLGALRESA